MGVFEIGGGGSPASTGSQNSLYAFDKSDELVWPPTPEQWAALNEMLAILFRNGTRAAKDIRTGNAAFVTGPASAVSGNIATFDGTTGKLLQDGGSTIAAISGGDFSLADVSLTEAQLESLNTTPIQIIAAPGAGQLLWVKMIYVILNVTAAYGSSPTLNAVYDGNGAFTALTTTISMAWNSTGTKYNHGTPSTQSYTTTGGGFDPANAAVNIRASADPSDPGTGAATARVFALYSTLTIP